MFGLWLSRNVLPIFTAVLPIPLWLILAAGLWLWIDKTSAIRQAVNRAVADVVHSAELDAAKAREDALRKIIRERERQAERDRIALAQFAELLSEAEAEKDNLNDEIAELESMPPPDACLVDDALLERLRNAR